jgi:hypothetical protein
MKPYLFTLGRVALLSLAATLVANPSARAADYDPAPAPAADSHLSANLSDVARLVQAGVGDKLVLSFINNTAGPFGMDSAAVIYLHDLGASDAVVDALMAHDRALGAATPAVVAQPAPVPVDADGDQAVVVQQPAPVTTEYFNQQLWPYGIWVNIEGYGLCWRPVVNFTQPGWQPYRDNGHWVYSNFGWYWVSDYSWGGIVFHYGRWVHDARQGWCWLPDTTWGPAWVSWRAADDYCGWAPLPPRTVWVAGSGLYFEGRPVGADFDFGFDPDYYVFVGRDHFRDSHLEHFAVPHREAHEIINRTHVVNNFTPARGNAVFNRGMDPDRFNHRPGGDNHPAAARPVTPAAPFTGNAGHDYHPGNPHHDNEQAPVENTPARPGHKHDEGAATHRPEPAPATIPAAPQRPVVTAPAITVNNAQALPPHHTGFTPVATVPQNNPHAYQPAPVAPATRVESQHYVPAPAIPELSSPRRQNSVATQSVPQSQPAATRTPAPSQPQSSKHHHDEQ